MKPKKIQIKVRNMQSRNGNEIPNQFEIKTSQGIFFQSYKSMVAFIDNNGKVILDSGAWDYSVTTGKYRNLFLGESKKATEQKIKSGEYKLANLN